jgi:hypothetical protein
MNMNVPFNKNWKNIAISVSGGCDSALLTYMLCQQIENTKVHIINNIRCWKSKPWQQVDFKRVLDWLKDRFPNIEFLVHTNFVPPELEWGDNGRTITDEYGKLVSGDTLELRAWAEYVCHHNDVDAYYNGVTRNPKGVDFGGMPTRDIDKNEDNKHLEYMIHMGKHVYHPFRFIDKSEIVKMYIELNIQEFFLLTRSCEGVFAGLDYTTYTPGQYVPMCNECFWCKERSWAIEQSK